MVKLYSPLKSRDISTMEQIIFNFHYLGEVEREVLLYEPTAERLKPFFSDFKLECLGESSCGLPGSKLYRLRLVK